MLNKVIRIADIPEGGIMEPPTKDQTLFLTKLNGEVIALESTCTHKGCCVAFGEISGKTIICPCCGSTFDLITGDVIKGPAKKPLKKHRVVIEGETVTVL